MRKTSSIDMIHGPLMGNILLFSLPLMASNFLQLLFNAVDVVVVGRFAGYASLAAVGSTSSIVYLFTNLLIGISVGVNVLLARYIGMGQHEKEISRTIHTCVLVALVGGTVLGGIGFLSARKMLILVSTPSDIFDLTLVYIRIYFLGSPFIMLYNYGAAALRARGDTRRPLAYLTISGVVNLVLNLLFVIVFRMDVAGVGIATVLSQALSAGLVLRYLICAQDAFRFSWREMRMDWNIFHRLAHIGIPAGIQSCLFSLSNVVIQGAINSYGSVVMAGCSAGTNIENFLYTSMNSFHHACQTFISQNIGAGRYERIRPILRACLMCTLVLGIVQSGAVLFFAPELIGIYNADPAVVEQGVLRLWIVASLYVIFGLADVLMGAIRGYGIPIAPVIINLVGTCLFRVVWIGLLDTSRFGVEYVYISYPLTWIIILAALTAFWIWLRRTDQHTRQEELSCTIT